MESLGGVSEDLSIRYRLTTRALYASLPFDTGQATLFVPEKGVSKTTNNESSEDESEGQSQSKRTRISGEEARKFYEDVLLMPKESRSKESRLKRKAESVKQRKRGTKLQRKTHEVKEITSLGQLFMCVQEGDFEPIRAALSRGLYDVNTVDNFNWTLLMCAAHAGHMTIVKYLLDQGADWLHHTDRRGNNAADLARTAGHTNIANFIESHNRTSSKQSYPSTQCLDETLAVTEDHREKRDHSSSSNLATDQCPSSFYCEICKMTIELGSSTVSKHTTSTVHQFSCQHKPKVTPYGIPESNRGFQLLLKGGWNPEKGLGSDQQGQQFPVKTVLKQDRLGFGLSSKAKPRVTHFSAHDEAAIKSHRERIGGEKERPPKKKDILKAAERDRRWERRMRRYINADYDFPI